jgi:nicotinamidase-related amidase
MVWEREMAMLKRDDAVLICIDVQGRLHEIMCDKEALDTALERMIRCAQLMEIPILATEQIPEKLGSTNEPFRSLLADATTVAKTTFSCCGDLRFLAELRAAGKAQVVLAGIEAHVCVYQTAMDLLNAGYEVFVLADAVSSRTPENKALALQAMRDAGARILPTETALFSLLRDAADPRFKELLKLIK